MARSIQEAKEANKPIKINAEASACPPLDIEIKTGLERKYALEVTPGEIPPGACGVRGKGGLDSGSLFKTTDPITLYRLWNSTNPGSKMGNWWSLDPPSGPIKDYRLNNAVCPSWSPLDMWSKATLKKDTNVAIGTGQSAICSRFLEYESSKVLQVYVIEPQKDLDINDGDTKALEICCDCEPKID